MCDTFSSPRLQEAQNMIGIVILSENSWISEGDPTN
jgi:hypothetical protein